MKTWPVIIGIVVILAVVSFPAAAISKSDLIAQYQGQSSPTIPIPIPMSTPSPLTPDSHVCSPFPTTLVPSYYEYSKFPAPTPAPTMSWEEWKEMMDRKRERLPYRVLT